MLPENKDTSWLTIVCKTRLLLVELYVLSRFIILTTRVLKSSSPIVDISRPSRLHSSQLLNGKKYVTGTYIILPPDGSTIRKRDIANVDFPDDFNQHLNQ